jgi:hypothetical protein
VFSSIVPRFDERVSPLLPEPPGQCVHVHTGGERGHGLLRAAAVRGEEIVDRPVVAEGQERLLRQR